MSFRISGVIVMFLIAWVRISIYTHFHSIRDQTHVPNYTVYIQLLSKDLSVDEHDRESASLHQTNSLGRAGPSFAAILTRSRREFAFIFSITSQWWALTLISLMPSYPPTCWFNKPETTSAITCRSRTLSNA
jgi:hypothetical protein